MTPSNVVSRSSCDKIRVIDSTGDRDDFDSDSGPEKLWLGHAMADDWSTTTSDRVLSWRLHQPNFIRLINSTRAPPNSWGPCIFPDAPLHVRQELLQSIVCKQSSTICEDSGCDIISLFQRVKNQTIYKTTAVTINKWAISIFDATLYWYFSLSLYRASFLPFFLVVLTTSHFPSTFLLNENAFSCTNTLHRTRNICDNVGPGNYYQRSRNNRLASQ